MDEIRLIELLTKKKSGEISLLEMKELSDLIMNFPDYRDLVSDIEDFCSVPIFKQQEQEIVFENRWASLHGKIQQSDLLTPNTVSRILPLVKLVSIAASVILIIGLAFYFKVSDRRSSNNQNTVLTKRGSKSTLILPDGSKVWLNGDSKISYNENFADGKRELFLDGEAYFDVIKDANNPFVVRTNSINVTVLGTAFNVKSYPDEFNVETTLIRGAIEVTFNKFPGKRVLMKPFEKLSVKNVAEINSSKDSKVQQEDDVPLFTLSRIKKLENDSSSTETLWLNNKIAFNRKPLSEIALQLSRWYNVEIIIEGSDLQAGEYSGVFNNVTLNQVMESLKLTGKFNYTIENNVVRIFP